jgi:hypothetical protein
MHIKSPRECAVEVPDAAHVAEARGVVDSQAVPVRILSGDGPQLKPAQCNLGAVCTAVNQEVVDGGALAQPQQLRVRVDVIVDVTAKTN